MLDLKGTFTAIITPFNEDQSIDYDALEKLIEEQVAAGIEGIVVMGTTGESPTIPPDEHVAVTKFVIDKVNQRCLVIAGAGSNCTSEAVGYSQHAAEDGADALLQVNPYYNKPTQEGLFQHFWTLAEEVDIPHIVYNIKGRTGVNVETSTMKRLPIDACTLGVPGGRRPWPLLPESFFVGARDMTNVFNFPSTTKSARSACTPSSSYW